MDRVSCTLHARGVAIFTLSLYFAMCKHTFLVISSNDFFEEEIGKTNC